jgi:alanine-glyoxylate transaminase/serine-glyoxylate transaminase/serine-pyruvate transaminase
VLVLNNGLFGQRLGELCAAHGVQPVIATKPWGTPFAASDVHEAVQQYPGLKAMLVVHGETSTGVANPVHELAQAAREHGLLVMADTIASLGGEPYRMDEWGIDVTVCASQKALEAPPGLGIIAVGERGWERMKERREPRGWMTDLQVLRKYAQEQADFHPHPGTMPVNAFVALRKSTQLILEEGLEYRWLRHNRIARAVRTGVRAMGLRVLASEEAACVNLTVVMTDGTFDPGDLTEFLKEQYGMHVARGIGAYFDKAIRVGHMGQNANLEVIVPFLVGLEQYLRKRGCDVPRGACLAGME